FSVSAHRPGVADTEGHHDREEYESDENRKHLRLIEHHARAVVILSSDGVGHQSRRADADHLGRSQYYEGEVAGDSHGRDRVGSKPPDPVEIDEEVEGL